MNREEEGWGYLYCLSFSSNETGRCRRADPGENPYHSPASCQLFWNLLYKLRSKKGGCSSALTGHWVPKAIKDRNLTFIFYVQDRPFFFKKKWIIREKAYTIFTVSSPWQKSLQNRRSRETDSTLWVFFFLLVLREMWIGSKDPGYVEHYGLLLFIWGEGLHEVSMLSSTLLGFGSKLGPLSQV